jgi:hypothetical protein
MIWIRQSSVSEPSGEATTQAAERLASARAHPAGKMLRRDRALSTRFAPDKLAIADDEISRT